MLFRALCHLCRTFRKRNQLHGQQFTLTARKLADFLTSLEAEELLLEQRLRDAEARKILTPKEQPVPTQTASLREKEPHSNASLGRETQSKDETLNIYEDF
jgi:putative transposase